MAERTSIVTAALPYANGPIHIGHLVEYIQTDIFVRNRRAQGHRCYFVCADDAHGAAIQYHAEQLSIAPEVLIARMKEAHERDFAKFNISFDVYHTTHSPENQELLNDIFARLKKSGSIYASTIRQLFDPVEQRFLADRYIKGECPRCGVADQFGDSCEACGATYNATELVNPKALRTGATPVIRSSKHFFFDIPQFESFLERWRYEVGLQPAIINKLEEWFEQGLRAWDISRDAPYFGFLIEGETEKYFYVWVDAPIGYLASFKRLCDREGLEFEEELNNPETELIHFIGKDIAYFHTLFWPAMLKAAGLKLPSKVHCHGFLTVNGAKMSKSRGTLVSAEALGAVIDPDFYRYFIFCMLDDGINDIDLNIETFCERTNADLVGKIVNIASRSATLLQSVADGRLGSAIKDEKRFDDYLASLQQVSALIDARRFSTASRQILSLADSTNKWLSDYAPWTLAKGNGAMRKECTACLTQALCEFYALMTALSPVTPDLATRARALFQRDKSGSSGKINFSAPSSYEAMDLRACLGTISIPNYTPLLQRISLETVLSCTEIT